MALFCLLLGTQTSVLALTGTVDVSAIVGSDPMMVSVNSSTTNGWKKIGDAIFVTTTFTEAVVVDTSGGTPTIRLETDGSAGTTAGDYAALYASGSGGATLTFSYVVQTGDTSSDLDYTATNALGLNSGTILANDNAAVAALTLPALAGANSLAGNAALQIDGILPTAGAASPAGGSYTSTQSVSLAACTDAQSGSGSTYYTTDGSAPDNTKVLYSTAISVSATTSLKYACYDIAGNLSPVITESYTITASSGGGGGGGGGGGSSFTSATYSLPNLSSSTPINISRPIRLSQTAGIFMRPVTLHDKNNTKLSVSFVKNSTVKNSDGTAFVGSIQAPKHITVGAIIVDGKKLAPLSAVQIITDPSPVILGEPATISFLLAGTDDETQMANVYWYNPNAKVYEIILADRNIDPATKTISVAVDHFSTYAVFATDKSRITETGNVPITDTDTAMSTPAALSDVPKDSWFAGFVDTLATKGIITGYPDGIFRPAEDMNRAEISKVVVKAFDIPVPTNITEQPFFDVPADQWFAPFVTAMNTSGIASGYPDGSFQPGRSVNRAEILKFLLEGAGIDVPNVSTVVFDDVPAEAWFTPYVAFAKTEGIVSGNTETIPAVQFERTLSVSSFGDDVTLLQEILTQLQYYTGPVTGYFGPLTQQALFGFQNNYQATWQADGYGFAGKETTRQLLELAGRDQSIIRTIFRPDDVVTRAEAAKMVTLVMALATKK